MSRQRYKFVKRDFSHSKQSRLQGQGLLRAQEPEWRENLIAMVILLPSVLSEIL